jgi:hypothetical protein
MLIAKVLALYSALIAREIIRLDSATPPCTHLPCTSGMVQTIYIARHGKSLVCNPTRTKYTCSVPRIPPELGNQGLASMIMFQPPKLTRFRVGPAPLASSKTRRYQRMA